MLAKHNHPDSTYKDWADYYKKNFNLKVSDPDQWLAYSLGPWKEKEVDGKMQKYKDRIYYLPEFLKATGLTDEQRNDYKVMNSLAVETKLNPNQRNAKIQSMAKLLHKVKKDLGFSLDLANNTYEAICMDLPDVVTGTKKLSMKNGNFFLNQYHDKKAVLSNWAIVWEDD